MAPLIKGGQTLYLYRSVTHSLMMPPSLGVLIRQLLVFVVAVSGVWGHGMLLEPPNRGSLWRYGFEGVPVNFNDNEQFCGGFKVQYEENGGKCGECGDNYALPRPRPQETGGQFGLGIIARSFAKGQVMNATALLTANHNGRFEFRLCPLLPDEVETEECFSRFPLTLVDGSTSYMVPSPQTGYYSALLQLPEDFTCSQCVLQWTYIAANSWGVCSNGTEGIGCGNQETFRTCSDIAIL